jgi:hypothetical protein
MANHENSQKRKTGRNLMPSTLLVVGPAVARRNRDHGKSAQPWRTFAEISGGAREISRRRRATTLAKASAFNATTASR